MSTESELKLNQGQQQAAEGFFNFLFSDQTELIISGPGGVGKTFLMGHLIDQVMPRYHSTCQLLGLKPLYNSVEMTATTNKAAEVLGKSTRRPTSTIHSFLNLKVTADYETGVSRLTKTRNWDVHRNKILFVDESSMIDGHLLRILREGTNQCKVIFVGDHCQLAPVSETISPIYKASLPFYELTEPMRNAEQPALMEVCQQLRQTVETKKFKPIRVIPGVIDLLSPQEMQQEVEAHFKDPSNQDRILAYTNKRVMDYNAFIRDMRGLPSTLTVGERVISNTAIQIGKEMMRVEDEFMVNYVDDKPTMFPVDPENGVSLEVLYCGLTGTHFSPGRVPVPVDQNYFNSLVKYYSKQKDWVKYYRLKETFPDLRPRDAATVHKAQGSTYDTVFIDLTDLSTCRNPDTVARLLYVAFTRARRRVVLYGNLTSKFGGIIT